MSSNTDTDDRVDAPVTNEELYIELQELSLLIATACGVIFAALAVTVIAVAYPEYAQSGAITLFAIGVLYVGLHSAYDERNWISSLYGILPGIDVDETVDELEDRLTNPDVRADGGEEDE